MRQGFSVERSTGLAGLVLVLVLAPAPGSAQAAAPRIGIYDCMSSSGDRVASVRMKSGGSYLYANHRKGKTLTKPTSGRYRVSGKKISWLSGTFKRADYVSTIYVSASSPKGYFSLDRKSTGIWTGTSCFWFGK